MIATNFIIIEKLDAVGMHHWSHGEILKLVREPDNPKDPNAIALYDQHQISKLAYLGWSDALQMRKVMLHEKVLNKVNMKAIVTGKWEVVLWEQGPQQTCNVAVKVLSCNTVEFVNYIKSIELVHCYIV